ncbi:Uncharacterised protein [Mycobacteroides abscessus subsp. massiliense]|nr:Uncharacterised protein [Mycobacteroides abscessus subsp. massiliense]SKG29110.1 Uncharacterised protein [Mycobacteroides abscessus subsp. massiliense]SKH68933.1 Uncharacterised protein [Mycobacteroides abscessus subsp. massiliense]SKI50743.1 Uncharacterised protein [Mycobacteroides abscessus subsp. massiliense]
MLGPKPPRGLWPTQEPEPPEPYTSYSYYELDSPERWVLYYSPEDSGVERLIVFVHGFGGDAVTSWLDFPSINLAKPENEWWRHSDLLFVGYKSTSDDISAVANRIRREIRKFYPRPYSAGLEVDGNQLRKDTTTPYKELIFVGHSLGGVVLRRVLSDAAQEWIDKGRPEPRPFILNTLTYMFSPASAGFRAAGWLGFLAATSLWTAIETFLSRSSSYTDLQPDSLVLRELRDRTVKYAAQDEFSALRANIVWANPDSVVISERYHTDYVDATWDGQTHVTVCKPRDQQFNDPWKFISTGEAYE